MKWVEQSIVNPRLTFCLIKVDNFRCERYVMYNLPERRWSLCAQVRSGILTLCTETGGNCGEMEEGRLCNYCDLEEADSKNHFMLYCFLLRYTLVSIPESPPGIMWLSDEENVRKKYKWLFVNCMFRFANFFDKAWNKIKKTTSN